MCPVEFGAGAGFPDGRVDLNAMALGYSDSGFAIGPPFPQTRQGIWRGLAQLACNPLGIQHHPPIWHKLKIVDEPFDIVRGPAYRLSQHALLLRGRAALLLGETFRLLRHRSDVVFLRLRGYLLADSESPFSYVSRIPRELPLRGEHQ